MARLFTIGVYGTDADPFFAALAEARVDVLIDVRRRRAVRGARYAFANARRLIARLAAEGIAYRHVLELAPDATALALQHAADARAKRLLSERTELDAAYLRRYRARVLERFDFAALAKELAPYAAPALFCIERLPAACHRGLVAPRLARAMRTRDVVHLFPAEGSDER